MNKDTLQATQKWLTDVLEENFPEYKNIQISSLNKMTGGSIDPDLVYIQIFLKA